MGLLKKIERELLEEWHKLQLETVPAIKNEALKAYYLKFRLFREQRLRGLFGTLTWMFYLMFSS